MTDQPNPTPSEPQSVAGAELNGALNDSDWPIVHKLLKSWRKVWHGDKAKYAAEFPACIVAASEELFAHDMCDAWNWNDYVKAACVIIQRHVTATASLDGGARQAFEEAHIECRSLNAAEETIANHFWQSALNFAFGKAAEVAAETSEDGHAAQRIAARLRQMQGKP